MWVTLAFNELIMKRLASAQCTEAVVQRCSVQKGSRRNFAKFTGKHLCQSLFLNKVARLRPATLLKKRLWHKWFPVCTISNKDTIFQRTPLVAASKFIALMEFQINHTDTFYTSLI